MLADRGAAPGRAHLAIAWLTPAGSIAGRTISDFEIGQTLAALVAMTFNFLLNNALTYADQRLTGAGAVIRGWLKFAVTCSVGLLANVGVAAVLVRSGFHPYAAALAGIALGSVWNYALSSRFVWGRF